MWAFTITDNSSIGEYVVNGYRLRQEFRNIGRDPDSIGYIRSANSTLKYSDFATRIIAGQPSFEEHYDGEIYMSTMWDFREMLNRMYPQNDAVQAADRRRPACRSRRSRRARIFSNAIFLGSMYVLGTTVAGHVREIA